MDTMTAAEAKQKFGKVITKAQREPVTITKHGEEVCVVLSAAQYAEDQKAYDFFAAKSIRRGLEDIKAGRVSSSDQVRARLALRSAALKG